MLIHPAVGHNRHGSKIEDGRGLLCPFGAAGSPSNTVWPGPRPTSIPSGMLIHPTIWPQYTNVTDIQNRTDNDPVAQGKPFYKRSPKNQTYQNKSIQLKKNKMTLIKTRKNMQKTNLNQQLTVRTVHKCVHITVHYWSIQYSTEQFFTVFPVILQTIIITQMLSTGGKGGCMDEKNRLYYLIFANNF